MAVELLASGIYVTQRNNNMTSNMAKIIKRHDYLGVRGKLRKMYPKSAKILSAPVPSVPEVLSGLNSLREQPENR